MEGGPESGHRDGQGVDREVRKGIVHVNGLSMMAKEGGNSYPSPIPCADTWSTSQDDDEHIFSNFGSSSDLRTMVSEWDDDPFVERKFLIPKPEHPLNHKCALELYGSWPSYDH